MPRKAKQPTPQPDRAALESAFRNLATPLSFEQCMKSRKLKKVLMRMAVNPKKKREEFDARKAAANDYD